MMAGFFSKLARQLYQYKLWLFLFCIFLTLLYAGLLSKEHVSKNHYSWLPDGGLAFGKHAIAFTDYFDIRPLNTDKENILFTAEIELKMPSGKNFGRHIFGFYSEKDPNNAFIVWQWGSHLIAMNGYDYDFSQRRVRVSAPLGKEKHIVRIRSEKNGVYLYVDGVLRASYRGQGFVMPNQGRKLRLVIANSLARKNSWQGTIYQFSLAQLVSSDKKQGDEFGRSNIIDYRFENHYGASVLDRSAEGNHLYLPEKPALLQRIALATDMNKNTMKNFILMDVFINFVGFMPLGFILFLIIRSLGITLLTKMIIVLFVGFSLSFFVEYGQSWMPARTSSLRDLLINTLGTGCGAFLGVLYLHVKKRRN